MAIVVHVGTRREIKFVMLIRKEISSLSFFGRAGPRIDRSTGASDKVSLSREKYSGEPSAYLGTMYCKMEVEQRQRLQ